MRAPSLRRHRALVAASLLGALPVGHALAQPAPRPHHAGPAVSASSATAPPPAPASASPSGSAPALDSGSLPTPPPPPPAHPGPAPEDIAKKAALTPIVPSPENDRKPAFQLYSEIDLPVLGVGLVLGSARFLRTQKAYCGTDAATPCDTGELNGIDRATGGVWRPSWSTASDIGLAAIVGGTGILLVGDEGVLSALNDSVVIAQSALIATALPAVMTISVSRPRPFMYGHDAPGSARASPDAALSFISSHTSVSFALATSTYVAMNRLHPRGSGPLWVLGIGLAAATFVGSARVAAGQHFPTDVVAGAIIGSSVGILIPSMHASPVQVVPSMDPKTGSKGLALTGAF